MNDIPDGLQMIDERFAPLEQRPDGEPTVLRVDDWPSLQPVRVGRREVQISQHGMSMSAAVWLSVIWAANVVLAFLAGWACGR